MLQGSLADSAGLQAEALAELTAKDGVRILTWPDDVLAALKDAWAKVAKEEGDGTISSGSVLDDIDKFRAKSPGARGAPTFAGAYAAATSFNPA